MTKKKLLPVCSSCPFLTINQGQRHRAGWYTLANLKRLWQGLRSGKSPGMVCHSSDPDSIHYGGAAEIKEGIKRECAGALVLVIKHLNEVSADGGGDYDKRHRYPLTKSGVGRWLERYLFGQLPSVEDRSQEVGLPWDEGARA